MPELTVLAVVSTVLLSCFHWVPVHKPTYRLLAATPAGKVVYLKVSVSLVSKVAPVGPKV